MARKRIRGWIGDLGERVASVEIDGKSWLIMREDLDALIARRETDAIRLLPGYDQWVLGPGTADAHVVPPLRRPLISRQANMAIAGGVVSGTWALRHDRVTVAWFHEAGSPPLEALASEVARLAAIHERPLALAVT